MRDIGTPDRERGKRAVGSGPWEAAADRGKAQRKDATEKGNKRLRPPVRENGRNHFVPSRYKAGPLCARGWGPWSVFGGS
ncbi:hypothetical protein SVIO_038540 [Streptomyces violaceusniger]|uniref:Uncharacterized protein n=1 Tax=Streptomyces violaceusniger TaxID=68280 RepID=A0A4D4KV95_STRVO|nr:hypothetical protein SVIO_038540 [Streptomyces violaceusniger]